MVIIQDLEKYYQILFFKITPLDDQSGADSSKGEVKVNIEYQTVDGKLYPMRSEGNDFIFADPQT